MNRPEPSFSVNVDVTNPGQFFACCGLLELAHRLWPGAEGWFQQNRFHVKCHTGETQVLNNLVEKFVSVELRQLDSSDDYSSPIEVPSPFELRLDWWQDEHEGGKQLKVWAGSMRNVRIARAMQNAIRSIDGGDLAQLFSHGIVVFEADRPKKKVEPFYFDSRRGSNARSLDIGFTPDTLRMTTIAYPATELLCLIGLQRVRPVPNRRVRVFDYFTWSAHLAIPIVSAAVCGILRDQLGQRLRFETAFRTGQKKHKCFLPATPIGDPT